MDIKLVQTAQLREISKLRLQTASLMQALLEARQQLQRSEGEAKNAVERSRAAERLLEGLTPGGSEFHGSPMQCAEWVADRLASLSKLVLQRKAAEQRAAEAEALLKALTAVEESQGYCPWCGRYVITRSHLDSCTWQAATAWLEAGDK